MACCKYLLLVVLLSWGCNNANVQSIAEDFAPMQCRAIQLREERFRVASELHRLAENPKAYETGKDSLLKVADDLKSKSTLLADTIKSYLDSLFSTSLINKEDRIRFTDMVRKINEDKGCSG